MIKKILIFLVGLFMTTFLTQATYYQGTELTSPEGTSVFLISDYHNPDDSQNKKLIRHAKRIGAHLIIEYAQSKYTSTSIPEDFPKQLKDFFKNIFKKVSENPSLVNGKSLFAEECKNNKLDFFDSDIHRRVINIFLEVSEKSNMQDNKYFTRKNLGLLLQHQQNIFDDLAKNYSYCSQYQKQTLDDLNSWYPFYENLLHNNSSENFYHLLEKDKRNYINSNIDRMVEIETLAKIQKLEPQKKPIIVLLGGGHIEKIKPTLKECGFREKNSLGVSTNKVFNDKIEIFKKINEDLSKQNKTEQEITQALNEDTSEKRFAISIDELFKDKPDAKVERHEKEHKNLEKTKITNNDEFFVFKFLAVGALFAVYCHRDSIKNFLMHYLPTLITARFNKTT